MIKYLLISAYERIRVNEIEKEFESIGVPFRENDGSYRDSVIIMNEVSIMAKVMISRNQPITAIYYIDKQPITAIYYIDKLVGLRNRNLFIKIFDIKFHKEE